MRTRRCTDAQNYTTEKKGRRRGREGDEDEGRGEDGEGWGEDERGEEGREEKAGDPAVERRADT